MREPLFPFACQGRLPARLRLPRQALKAAPLAPFAFFVLFILYALPALLGAMAFTGCANSALTAARYRTSDSADVWVNGSRVHRHNARTLEFASTFEEVSPDFLDGYQGHRSLSFLIGAANRSPLIGPAGPARLLDPMDFRLRIPGTDSALLPVDPELQLERARAKRTAEMNRYANEQGIEAMLVFPLVVLETASLFTSRTPEEIRQAEVDAEDRRKHEAQSRNRHENAMMEASARERHWSGGTLRKTTLQPGAEHQGRVLFAVDGFKAAPDTLILQYREADAYTDLGVYVQFRDSLPEPKPTGKAASPVSYPFRP